MFTSIASDVMPTPHITEASVSGLYLPESTWDEAQLLDYMRMHDRAIGGLERKTLKHEFCFGAACQIKYDQLDGKWTAWAKDQGYPPETFRRRRLLYVRAGSLTALDKYSSKKMEAYYDLGIYRRPSPKDLDALDAEWGAKTKGHTTEATSPNRDRAEVVGIPEPDRKEDQARTEGDEAEETLQGLTVSTQRQDALTAQEILGKVGSLLVEAERVGLDDSCLALLDDIATTVVRLRGAQGRNGVAA